MKNGNYLYPGLNEKAYKAQSNKRDLGILTSVPLCLRVRNSLLKLSSNLNQPGFVKAVVAETLRVFAFLSEDHVIQQINANNACCLT